MSERHDPAPAALYARVSSECQDVDLSVSAQLRALRDYADKNGYVVARTYVDEAESGRIADRPEFRKMIDEAAKPNAPFREILVWKFSRFTRKREHAVAFKSMLRRKGVRVVSITEHADDSPTGKLMEAIIESVDEFYSENLAQEVVRGMRESASRGFWIASRTPYGYNRVMVQDGPKKRPTLETDPTTSAILKRIFDMAEAGRGMLDITRTLNDEGIASPAGKLWGKTSVHAILRNEVYTGTLVWGVDAKDGAPPVRVENAFPAIVSQQEFRRITRSLRSKAPARVNPRRASSPYLLSGLVKCEKCGKALTAAEAKSGKYSYYVCHSLLKKGKGTCKTPRLNSKRFEKLMIDQIRANILTESNIRDLVRLMDEEMDGVAAEQRERLENIEAGLIEVRRRLDRVWHVIENSELDISDATGQGIALRAPGRAGQRGHHRRLRRGHERLPDDQRNHRIEGLHQVLRQGDRGQARKSNGLLHPTHAPGQPDRGRRRRRGGSPRPSSQFSTRWWAYFDDRQNHLRIVAGKVVNLWWTVGSTTEVAHRAPCHRRPTPRWRRSPTTEA